MQARPGGRTLTLGGLAIDAQAPLYEFSRGETHKGAYAQGLDPIAIITPSEQWAYVVTVPLNRSELKRHERFCIKISVLVHAGCVGIGILQRDENSFAQEVPVAVRAAGARLCSEYRPSRRRDHWSFAIIRPAGPVGFSCGSSTSSALRTKLASARSEGFWRGFPRMRRTLGDGAAAQLGSGLARRQIQDERGSGGPCPPRPVVRC